MGLYHSLNGKIKISKKSLEDLLICKIDDESDVNSLLAYGQFNYFENEYLLDFELETKRSYLFQGLYRALAYYKDVEGFDKITFLSESTNWEYVEEIQIRPNFYRFFDVKRKKVVFNLMKEGGWENVICLADKLQRDFQNGTIDIFGKKGEFYSIDIDQTDLMLYALENEDEFRNYELNDAGSTVRWPGIFAESFDINEWILQAEK